MKTKMLFAALALAILAVTTWATLTPEPADSAALPTAPAEVTGDGLICESTGHLTGLNNLGGPGECAYDHSCMAECHEYFHACTMQYPNPPGGPLHEQCHTALYNCLNPECCL